MNYPGPRNDIIDTEALETRLCPPSVLFQSVFLSQAPLIMRWEPLRHWLGGSFAV